MVRRYWSRLVVAALALLLLWFALRSVSPAAVWQILRQLQPVEILVLLLANVLILLTLSARWWILLRALGYTVPPVKLLGYRLAAFSVSYFTPGPHFGGEPVQVYTVAEWHRVPYSAAIAAVTMDKLLEMLINFSFLAAGVLIVVRQQVLSVSLERQLVFAALLLLVVPFGLLSTMWFGKHPISGSFRILSVLWSRLRWRTHPTPAYNCRVPGWIATVYNSENQVIWLCRRRPRTLLVVICISLISWAGMICEYWLMTWMLGLGLSPVEAISALVAARVAILLPIPGGLGALEASQAFAMSSLGFGPAAGISMVVLIRSRDLLLALVGMWIGGVQIWQRVATHRSPGPPQAGTHATHPPSLPYETASSAANDDATFSYDVEHKQISAGLG